MPIQNRFFLQNNIFSNSNPPHLKKLYSAIASPPPSSLPANTFLVSLSLEKRSDGPSLLLPHQQLTHIHLQNRRNLVQYLKWRLHIIRTPARHSRSIPAYLFRQPKGRLILFSKDCLDAVKLFLHGFLLLSAVKIRISLGSRVKNEVNAYLSNALKDESNGKTNDNH